MSLAFLCFGRGLVVEERLEERTRFGENDAADILFCRQLGKLFGDIDRFFEAAEFVDKAVCFGLSSGPDTALAERISLFCGLVTALGDLWYEVVVIDGVCLFDHLRAFLGRPFFGLAKDTRVLAAHCVLVCDAEPGVEALDHRFAHEHTDRTRDGRGFGDDLVGVAGDVIAARRSDIGHRNDDRLFGLGVL